MKALENNKLKMMKLIFLLVLIQLCSAQLMSKQKCLGEPCSRRDLWSVQTYSANTKNQALDFNSKPVNPWSEAVYLEYNRTLVRTAADSQLRDRFGPLHNLVTVECIDYQGVFIKKIEEYLMALTTQRSWTSPAHDRDFAYYNGRYFVELFSADIARQISQVVYMLNEKLSAITKTAVANALEQRIFKPMRAMFDGDAWVKQKHFWEKSEDNWNTVCWSGVVTAAVASLTNQADRDNFIEKAAAGSQYMWHEFKPDGFFPEGTGYYNHVFQYFIIMRQAIMEATDGKKDLFLLNPNIPKYASFGFEFPMTGTVTAMFGDDYSDGIKDGIRNYIESTFSPDPTPNYSASNLDWTFTGTVLMYDMKMNPKYRYPVPAANRVTTAKSNRKYYESSGVLVVRPPNQDGLAATFKLLGGSTAPSGAHNHDDAGTYQIVLKGVRVAGDPGGPISYNLEWSQRYNHPIFNSHSHPVPVINNKLQVRNMVYYAKPPTPSVVSTSFTDSVDTIVFDLKAAYSDPALLSLTRTNTYTRTGNQTVVIRDTAKFSTASRFEVALSSRFGVWTEKWKATNSMLGTFTVGSVSVNVYVLGTSPISYTKEEVSALGIKYSRIGVVIPSTLGDSISVTYS